MTRKALISMVAALAIIGSIAAPAVAQTTTTPDYYNDTSTETGTGPWLSGLTDASLDDILTLLTRVGTFIIGGGVTAQGGAGSAGALLTGLLIAGTLAAIGIRSGAGATGGLSVGLVAAFLFVSVGVGPTWAYPVVLFMVGLIVAGVFLRVFR